MRKPKLNLIYAISRNGVIGNGSDIPWYLPPDLQRFKLLTLNKIVIMGRKTYESLPLQARPLKDRINIVITSNPHYDAGVGVHVVPNCSAAMKHAQSIAESTGISEIWVIGGESVYDSFSCLADMHYVTLIEQNVEGDVYGPTLDGMQLLSAIQQPPYYKNLSDHPIIYSYCLFARRKKPSMTHFIEGQSTEA